MVGGPLGWGRRVADPGELRRDDVEEVVRDVRFGEVRVELGAVVLAGAEQALAADRLPMPGEPGSSETADILVAMLRFSLEPARRGAAVTALAQAGLVEDL